MTDEKWAGSTDPEAMLKVVRKCSSERKLRLFACASARELWSLYDHNRSREAVEVSECYADGAVGDRELKAACEAAKAVTRQVTWETAAEWQDRAGYLHHIRATARDVAHINISGSVVAGMRNAMSAHYFIDVVDARRSGQRLMDPKQVCQVRDRTRLVASQRLRDIFGNPFRPLVLNPAHRTSTVISLARAAYDERRLPSGELELDRLAVLADALEEAGCDNADILTHLRGPGPHVRGCHVIDLCLGLS